MLLLVHKVRQLKRGWEGGAASPQTPGACARDGLRHILEKALPLTPADTAPSLHTSHCQQQAGQADHSWASPLSAASCRTSHPQSILLWGKGEETAKKKNPGDSHRTHPHSAGKLAPPGSPWPLGARARPRLTALPRPSRGHTFSSREDLVSGNYCSFASEILSLGGAVFPVRRQLENQCTADGCQGLREQGGQVRLGGQRVLRLQIWVMTGPAMGMPSQTLQDAREVMQRSA